MLDYNQVPHEEYCMKLPAINACIANALVQDMHVARAYPAK